MQPFGTHWSMNWRAIKTLGRRHAFFIRSLIVTLLYVSAAKGGLAYAVVGSTVTLFWAPSGIALVALLAYGYRMSIAVVLGAFLANAWTGVPLFAVIAIAIGDTLEALIAAFLLVRVAQFDSVMGTRRDVFAFIGFAAFLSTMSSATVGAASLAAAGVVDFGDYGNVWMKWWLGDTMGVLVVAPLLLLLNRPPPVPQPQRLLEAFCLCAALVLVSLKIFGAPKLTGQGYYAAALAVFPFVLWGALRFELIGAGVVTLLVSLLAVWGTYHGTGPFALEQPVDSLVRWCAFAIVVAVTGLLLAASVTEQRHAKEELELSYAELEQRVLERTRDLAAVNADLEQEMARRRHLQAELVLASEKQAQAIGRELHDGLGQHLTSVALFCATLRHHLVDRAQPEAKAAQRIEELINEALAMTRSMARGLYPVALEVGGLSAALGQLVEHTRTLLQRDCSFICDARVQVVDPVAALNLYRIAQEAISNAAKYSQANHLRIELSKSDGQYRLTISDDGIGIESALQSEGLGMSSMRFRAHLLGGDLEIHGNGQQGTTVSVTYPDPENQSDRQPAV